ncbi:hypothetical protein NLI96_g8168 [Meripilus lineatus]|uniref:Uncharacterized protein n=1 Tax=Meripilus lineatus TaxID=2056292 RepID=A0AAD5V2I8_9APHY|nr:hypothetical protein NLI96_g8168 [Physisporinus lineatus]
MSQKGGIAGGTIIAGVIVVTLVTVAAINSAHLIYIIVSLASLLFGLVLYNCRRIVFVCKDPNLPELQISLFLTIEAAREGEDSGENSDGNQHLVFSIGGNTKGFDVTVPITTGSSKKAGQPKIGFATIDDNDFDERVRPQSWELAPARLLENGIWEKGDVEANQEDEFIAENMTERARRIAMGVSDKPDDPEARRFSPFLVIDSKNFGPMGNFKVKSDIFLHAFRTGGCKAGDYGDPVMEARKLDRLTDTGGHRVKELDQVTTFYVTCSKKSGQVKLKIGKNRPEDVKKFRQEHGFRFWFCKRNKGAKNEGNSTTFLLPS